MASESYIYSQIAAERRRQVDEKGYTAEHDDQHDISRWRDLVLRCVPTDIRFYPQSLRREMLVQLAALCVAAIAAHDRKNHRKR